MPDFEYLLLDNTTVGRGRQQFNISAHKSCSDKVEASGKEERRELEDRIYFNPESKIPLVGFLLCVSVGAMSVWLHSKFITKSGWVA